MFYATSPVQLPVMTSKKMPIDVTKEDLKLVPAVFGI
jgi:hypothetical protein